MTYQWKQNINVLVESDDNALAKDKKKTKQTLLCDLNIQAVPANSCIQRKDTNRLLIASTFCSEESREINYQCTFLDCTFFLKKHTYIYLNLLLKKNIIRYIWDNLERIIVKMHAYYNCLQLCLHVILCKLYATCLICN